jgi:hypothetical protein
MNIRSVLKNVFGIDNGKSNPSDDSQNIYNIGELYHDFSLFRVKNAQLPGPFYLNQCCKAPIIQSYIALAIAKSKKNIDDQVTFAELFCADGYYAMVATLFGATKSYGIDNNKDGYFDKAIQMAQLLKINNVEFINGDIAKSRLKCIENVDIVANIGGLYHVEHPVDVLIKSYKLAKKYLIIQSVVSMANEDPYYFETPAPGWSWGCRFNKKSFHEMVQDLGYNIYDYHFNELVGNDRPEDRGSVYYLIEK